MLAKLQSRESIVSYRIRVCSAGISVGRDFVGVMTCLIGSNRVPGHSLGAIPSPD